MIAFLRSKTVSCLAALLWCAQALQAPAAQVLPQQSGMASASEAQLGPLNLQADATQQLLQVWYCVPGDASTRLVAATYRRIVTI